MHASGWNANVLCFGVGHFANGIGEGAGGVDDALGLDVPFVAGELVPHVCTAYLQRYTLGTDRLKLFKKE